MDIKITTITPQIATNIMAKNPQNRNIKRGNVTAIARDMLSGSWQLNGDAIRIGSDGSLIDGQHRLEACIKSGAAFETVLITGLDPTVRNTIDSGSRRSHGDRLAMRGVSNANAVSACLRMMACCANDLPTMTLTSSESDKILDAHPNVLDSVRLAIHSFQGLSSMLAAIHYIGTITDDGKTSAEFLSVWKTGVPTKENDPAHTAREYIMRRRATFRGITPAHSKQILCWSFNKFAKGETACNISMRSPSLRIGGWFPSNLGI